MKGKLRFGNVFVHWMEVKGGGLGMPGDRKDEVSASEHIKALYGGTLRRYAVKVKVQHHMREY